MRGAGLSLDPGILSKAAQGDARAQLAAGLACQNRPNATPQDLKEAAQWFHKAAQQGNAEAQTNLGICFLWGNGVDKSWPTAARWFGDAAKQGLPRAQYWMGELFRNGTAVPRSYAEAMKWYLLAAAQGDAAAHDAIANLYFFGHGVKQDDAKAAGHLKIAADKGFAPSQKLLGDFHQLGLGGLEKSDMEAAAWYAKAAALQFEPAMTALADCYLNGKGLAQDPAQAVS